MPEESKTKYFQDEHAIKQLIEKKAGTIVISGIEIRDSDVRFFKDGEMRYDSTRNTLVVSVNGVLRRVGTYSIASGQAIRSGTGVAVAGGIRINFSSKLPVPYILIIDCYKLDDPSQKIAYTYSDADETGFTLTPLEDCTCQYIACIQI